MKTNNRCPVCDRPEATADDWMRCAGGEGEHLCWADAASPCAGPRVDWRARAFAAEAERDKARADAKRLREREEHFARALSVADGGQYRNDWDGALRRMLAERDTLRAEVGMLRGVGCDELDGAEVRGPCGACLKCARMERDEARRLLATAARGELPRCDCGNVGMRYAATKPSASVCDECHAADVSRGWVKTVGDGWPDLPHAAALRAAIGGAK